MKKSLKGALLSGLVLPGVGQIWLKHYLRGLAFIMAVSGCLAVVVINATRQALTLLEKAEAVGGEVDLVAIANSASRSAALSDQAVTASFILLCCWGMATLDAYLLGRKKDLEDEASLSGSR